MLPRVVPPPLLLLLLQLAHTADPQTDIKREPLSNKALRRSKSFLG